MVKEVDLYSAFIVVPHTQGTRVRITQCYLQITPYLPLPRKHSPVIRILCEIPCSWIVQGQDLDCGSDGGKAYGLVPVFKCKC